jgi:hypothetical protein
LLSALDDDKLVLEATLIAGRSHHLGSKGISDPPCEFPAIAITFGPACSILWHD